MSDCEPTWIGVISVLYDTTSKIQRSHCILSLERPAVMATKRSVCGLQESGIIIVHVVLRVITPTGRPRSVRNSWGHDTVSALLIMHDVETIA